MLVSKINSSIHNSNVPDSNSIKDSGFYQPLEYIYGQVGSRFSGKHRNLAQRKLLNGPILSRAAGRPEEALPTRDSIERNLLAFYHENKDGISPELLNRMWSFHNAWISKEDVSIRSTLDSLIEYLRSFQGNSLMNIRVKTLMENLQKFSVRLESKNSQKIPSNNPPQESTSRFGRAPKSETVFTKPEGTFPAIRDTKERDFLNILKGQKLLYVYFKGKCIRYRLNENLEHTLISLNPGEVQKLPPDSVVFWRDTEITQEKDGLPSRRLFSNYVLVKGSENPSTKNILRILFPQGSGR